MIIPTEIKVNEELENKFREYLEGVINGFYMDEDKAEIQVVLDDIRANVPEKWNDTTRQELGLFLMFKAGFTCASGYCAEDFKFTE